MDECLKVHWFQSLGHARQIIEVTCPGNFAHSVT